MGTMGRTIGVLSDGAENAVIPGQTPEAQLAQRTDGGFSWMASAV